MKPRCITGALAILLALAGCPSGIGDICTQDSDCKTGLRCAVVQGKRGVCTYPEGVSDAAARPDQRLPDTGAPDATLDALPDLPPGETAPADGAPDLPPADSSVDARSELGPEDGSGDTQSGVAELGTDGP